MSEPERFEVLILGSGFGGKLIAWHMAQSGRRTAVVERRWIGGSCPNIACLPPRCCRYGDGSPTQAVVANGRALSRAFCHDSPFICGTSWQRPWVEQERLGSSCSGA